MKGLIEMSARERKRLVVLSKVTAGEMSLRIAAETLGLSYRQTIRVAQRYRAEGDGAIIHRGRGRVSPRAFQADVKETVIALVREHYEDYGPTLAAEELEDEHGIVVDHETLRRWMIDAGLWAKKRRRAHHRRWRERKKRFGELVQMDGSHHKWLGPQGPEWCLMNMVDDATGKTLSVMDEEETTDAALTVVMRWIEKYGIPEALYLDKKNVYVTDREPTVEEELAGTVPMTAFGRAMDGLGIRIVTAHSPQAKGRVERNHGVYQDRYVKKLRRKGVTTIEGANEVLGGGFVDGLNRRFAVDAADPCDAHLPADGVVLVDVLCYEDERVVTGDGTISYDNHRFQLEQGQTGPFKRDKVIVRRRLDGSVTILHKGRIIPHKEVVAAKKTERSKQPIAISPKEASGFTSMPQNGRVPPEAHPWKKTAILDRRSAGM